MTTKGTHITLSGAPEGYDAKLILDELRRGTLALPEAGSAMNLHAIGFE